MEKFLEEGGELLDELPFQVSGSRSESFRGERDMGLRPVVPTEVGPAVQASPFSPPGTRIAVEAALHEAICLATYTAWKTARTTPTR